MAGGIKPDWFVFCSDCYDHEHLEFGNRPKAELSKIAKAKGYKLVRGYGWLCPRCSAIPAAAAPETKECDRHES